MKHVLDTERLSVRELEERDLDFVAEMLAHEEVMRFWPRTQSREEAKQWIANHRERYVRDGYGYWLPIEKSSGKPVGQVGLLASLVDGVREPNIGYMLHRPFWKRGFAVEAAAAIRDHALVTLGLPRVITMIRPENEASRAVAAKIGMIEEKRVTYAGFLHIVLTAGSRG